MITVPHTGKVIWHLPKADRICSISNSGGEDEFIIAPFMKASTIISIKGIIEENDQDSVANFFKTIQPAKTNHLHSTPKKHYISAVKKAISAIQHNSFEKVVIARQYFIEKPVDLHSLFNALVTQYPGAFVYCFMLADGTCMMGATPETLLKKEGNTLITEALGGTEQANGYSEKEYKEHGQIIIDISNKLNALDYQYEQSGTTIKVAGNVSHLSTQFKVNSQSEMNDDLLLRALHPTSAVCGLPYQAAYDFLVNEEDFDRKYYTGYLGIRQGSGFNFYVNLRCADIFSNGALLYAGAGITGNSVAEKEWQETSDKLDTLLKLIG